MKRLLVMTFILMFTMVPVVMAQGEAHDFNYTDMTPHESVIEIIPDVQIGDMLYLNITVQAGMKAYVNIYSSETPLPAYEVYGNNNVYDNLFVNITTTVAGIYNVYLFNDNDEFIYINGWWALNLNISATMTETETGTDTTSTTDTWTGGITPPIHPTDYFGIFIDVFVRWVAPAIIVVFVIFFLYRFCRAESLDYLTIFEEKELLPEQEHRQKEE